MQLGGWFYSDKDGGMGWKGFYNCARGRREVSFWECWKGWMVGFCVVVG